MLHLLWLCVIQWVHSNNYLQVLNCTPGCPGYIRVSFHGTFDQWDTKGNHQITHTQNGKLHNMRHGEPVLLHTEGRIFCQAIVKINKEKDGMTLTQVGVEHCKVVNPLRLALEIHGKSEPNTTLTYILYTQRNKVFIYSGKELLLFRVGIYNIPWIQVIFTGDDTVNSWLEPSNHILCQEAISGTKASSYLRLEIAKEPSGNVIFKKLISLESKKTTKKGNPLISRPFVMDRFPTISPFLYIFRSDGDRISISATVAIPTRALENTGDPETLQVWNTPLPLGLVRKPEPLRITGLKNKPEPEQVPYPSFYMGRIWSF